MILSPVCALTIWLHLLGYLGAKMAHALTKHVAAYPSSDLEMLLLSTAARNTDRSISKSLGTAPASLTWSRI